jgi:hypothetical protein
MCNQGAWKIRADDGPDIPPDESFRWCAEVLCVEPRRQFAELSSAQAADDKVIQILVRDEYVRKLIERFSRH